MGSSDVEISDMSMQYRIGIVTWLFIVWIISLPFRNIHIIGNLSFDNLLVPVLIMAWFVIPGCGIKNRSSPQSLVQVFIIISIYIIGSLFHYRLIQGGYQLTSSAWNLARDGGYFILPLLFVANKRVLRYTNSSIIIIAMIGCVSAFLVSLGVLHLDKARIDEARLGIETLNKATGVFSNFGDLALLLSYTMLLVVAHKGNELAFKLGTKKGKLLIVCGAALGILGTQSRNVMLSVGVGLSAYWLFSKLYKVHSSKRYAVFMIVLSLGILLFALVIIFSDQIIGVLSNWGGGDAANTAGARLMQYRHAISLFDQAFLMGIPYSNSQNIMLAESIHNMWLGLFLRGGVVAVIAVALLFALIFHKGMSVLRYYPGDKQAKISLSFACVALVSTMFFPAGSLVYWFMMGVALSTTASHKG